MLLLSDFYAFYGCSALFICASSYVIYSNPGFLCLDLLAGGRPAAKQKKVTCRRATPGQPNHSRPALRRQATGQQP